MWVLYTCIGVLVFVCVVVAALIGISKIPKVQSLLKLPLSYIPTFFYALAIVTGVIFALFSLVTALGLVELGGRVDSEAARIARGSPYASEILLSAYKADLKILEALWEKYALIMVPLSFSFFAAGRMIALLQKSHDAVTQLVEIEKFKLKRASSNPPVP